MNLFNFCPDFLLADTYPALPSTVEYHKAKSSTKFLNKSIETDQGFDR